MVCYARPASWLLAIVAVAWLVFAVPVSHFFNTAAVVMAVTVAAAVAAAAAALVFAIFMSTRRRRAAAGGCVSCQFRCQHAMTEPARWLWLVTTADRRPPGSTADRPAAAPGHRGSPGRPGSPGHPGTAPTRSVSVLLPVPTVRSAATGGVGAESCGLAAPQWPDRPAYRARQVRVPQRERAGSPTLSRLAWHTGAAAHWCCADHDLGAARLSPPGHRRRARRRPDRRCQRARRGRQGDRGRAGLGGQRVRRPPQCGHAGRRDVEPHQDCRGGRR